MAATSRLSSLSGFGRESRHNYFMRSCQRGSPRSRCVFWLHDEPGTKRGERAAQSPAANVHRHFDRWLALHCQAADLMCPRHLAPQAAGGRRLKLAAGPPGRLRETPAISGCLSAPPTLTTVSHPIRVQWRISRLLVQFLIGLENCFHSTVELKLPERSTYPYPSVYTCLSTILSPSLFNKLLHNLIKIFISRRRNPESWRLWSLDLSLPPSTAWHFVVLREMSQRPFDWLQSRPAETCTSLRGRTVIIHHITEAFSSHTVLNYT